MLTITLERQNQFTLFPLVQPIELSLDSSVAKEKGSSETGIFTLSGTKKYLQKRKENSASTKTTKKTYRSPRKKIKTIPLFEPLVVNE